MGNRMGDAYAKRVLLTTAGDCWCCSPPPATSRVQALWGRRRRGAVAGLRGLRRGGRRRGGGSGVELLRRARSGAAARERASATKPGWTHTMTGLATCHQRRRRHGRRRASEEEAAWAAASRWRRVEPLERVDIVNFSRRPAG
jgi:hypothetical protein